MQICRTLAGYSYARADIVRRAMSKKKSDVMEKEREGFVLGAVERGIQKAAAERVFDEMVGFAKYAFNKSHATVYAITSYRTAYLKKHYPAQYFAALMSSVLDKTDKVREYTLDAQKLSIRVARPDVNTSGVSFDVVNGEIQFGLLAIKNIGRPLAESIIRERGKRPFKSFVDFVNRMCDKEINKRSLEFLIKSGSFDSLGTPRSALIVSYEDILARETERMRNNISGQMDLFSLAFGIESESVSYQFPEVEEYSLKELLSLEKESSGMYFSGHLLDDYSKNAEALSPDRSLDIIAELTEPTESPRYRDKAEVSLCAVITSKKTKNTKSGDVMAFFGIDDKYGELEIIAFPKQYSVYEDEIFEENAVYLVGNISDEDGEVPRIILREIYPLMTNEAYHPEHLQSKKSEHKSTKAQRNEQPMQQSRVFIRVSSLKDDRISMIERLSLLYPGKCEIVLYDLSSKKYVAMKNCTLIHNPSTEGRLKSIFGDENVVFKG